MFVNAIKNIFNKNASQRMLDDAMTSQLKTYLEKLQVPIELVATLDDSKKAYEMRALLDEISALSDKIILRHDGNDVRKPSFSVNRPGEAARIRFAGLPMGHEFTSLILALLQTGGHPPKIEAEVIERIRSLKAPLNFETYITMSCHNCPDGVQALNMMAVLNPGISHTMIDGNMFLSEIEQHKIKAVPTVFLNGAFFDQGRKTVVDYLEKLKVENLTADASR